MTPEPGRFAQTLVAGMPDAIVYADAAGLIRIWNTGSFSNEDGTMTGIAAIMRDVTARFDELRMLPKQLAARRTGTAA
jgi:hypothetical protein